MRKLSSRASIFMRKSNDKRCESRSFARSNRSVIKGKGMRLHESASSSPIFAVTKKHAVWECHAELLASIVCTFGLANCMHRCIDIKN